MTRDGQTCVTHPDTGRLVRARELSRAEWRRLVQQEAAAWQDDEDEDLDCRIASRTVKGLTDEPEPDR